MDLEVKLSGFSNHVAGSGQAIQQDLVRFFGRTAPERIA